MAPITILVPNRLSWYWELMDPLEGGGFVVEEFPLGLGVPVFILVVVPEVLVVEVAPVVAGPGPAATPGT